MGTAGMSVADAQAIAHLFDVLPFVVIGAFIVFGLMFFKGAKTQNYVEDDYDRFLRGDQDVSLDRFRN